MQKLTLIEAHSEMQAVSMMRDKTINKAAETVLGTIVPLCQKDRKNIQKIKSTIMSLLKDGGFTAEESLEITIKVIEKMI